MTYNELVSEISKCYAETTGINYLISRISDLLSEYKYDTSEIMKKYSNNEMSSTECVGALMNMVYSFE